MSLIGNIVGHAAATVGRAEDYLTPGSGSGTLTDVGRAIYSPNSVLSNPGAINPFARGSAFQVVGSPSAAAGAAPKAGSVASDTATAPAGGAYSGTYSGGANGTRAASGAGSTADIAAYQDQINSLNQLLGNADITQRNGQNSIEQGYNNSVAQLEGNHQSVLNQFDTQKSNTTNDYAKNVDRINANARQGFNSLQALLQGTGSAGNVLAPFAVSQQANSQRGASSDAFARNLQAVDQGVLAAQQNYNNQKKTLEGQKNDQLSKLLSSIDQQKIQYQQQLAAANNQLNIARGGNYATPTANNDAIAALIANQNGLAQQFTQPNFTVSDYVAPQTDLAQYQAQAAQIGGLNNDPSTTPQDDTASALAALLKQQQQGSTNAYAY
jgi:hypothetical protein